jgi:hypothetical protein
MDTAFSEQGSLHIFKLIETEEGMIAGAGKMPIVGTAFPLPVGHRGFYRLRHKIENFFQRLKIYKRISTRYEKLAHTFFNFILLGAVFDWLKSF